MGTHQGSLYVRVALLRVSCAGLIGRLSWLLLGRLTIFEPVFPGGKHHSDGTDKGGVERAGGRAHIIYVAAARRTRVTSLSQPVKADIRPQSSGSKAVQSRSICGV
jgi:hypothetical protein